MNNEQRDTMINEIHTAVVTMQQYVHNPLTCPTMAVHQEAHGRHVRWFFWSIGAMVGIGGLCLGIVKYVSP